MSRLTAQCLCWGAWIGSLFAAMLWLGGAR